MNDTNKIALYQDTLNQVSRSFAYSISILDKPLKEYVALAYILCRIIDTVEDAPWPSQELQTQAFQNLKKSFIQKDFLFDTTHIQKLNIPNEEVTLLQNANIFVNDYHNLPLNIHVHIKKLTLSMIDGMLLFPNDKIKIKTLHELNTYCFFVAGIVGECLTSLVETLSNQKTKMSLLNSYYFGLFLQKINILKDQHKDEKENKFFVFDKKIVFQSTISNAKHVLEYITSIPSTQVPYKTFCLIAFLLGLKVLVRIDLNKNTVASVPRSEAQELFLEISNMVDNNELINQKVEQFFSKIKQELLPIDQSEEIIDLEPYKKILEENRMYLS